MPRLLGLPGKLVLHLGLAVNSAPGGGWEGLAKDTQRGILSQAQFYRKVYRWNLEHPLGEGNGTPLQYSCLENPMGGGAW